ncbi:MAG: TlpA family protein disulfide reductase, partial [Bacteriovoracales bacterium]
SSKYVLKKYESALKTLNLTTIDDQKISFDPSEASIVILNLWAPWCGPCVDEFPSLISLRKKFSTKEVLIVGIIMDEENSQEQLKKTIEDHGLNFPNVFDKSGMIYNLFNISSIPATIIFHQGKILDIKNGEKDFEAIEFIETLEKLLNKNIAINN